MLSLFVPIVLSGCTEGTMSTLDPAGSGAADIAWITWIMMIGTLLLMVVMSILGLHAALRLGGKAAAISPRNMILFGGVVVPSAVLLVLLVYGVRTGDAMLPIGSAEVDVRVTGHQWWWQFEYVGPDGQALHTANELHLPIGQTIDIHLSSADVIHAFWVPALGGKIDAIPGRVNTLRLHPTRIGLFRGQCAEFCGAQHAHMAFEVHVHSEADFAAFLERLAGADRRQAGSTLGREIFRRQCASCHSLSTEFDLEGPNLATLPDRQWLGAGTIPNSEDALRAWIAHHQQLKPGNRMPDHSWLEPEAVEALAEILEAQP